MAALGGGFPVDVLEAVAGDVFAELLEVAPAPDLALGVDAERAAIQEQRGEAVSILGEVWINAHFTGHRQRLPARPEAEW